MNTESNNHKIVPHRVNKGVKTFKIIVIGDSGVGKSCLTNRFVNDKNDNPQSTTYFDLKFRTIDIDGETMRLEFWDTAGQERYASSMVASYYRNANAVILVYDVTRRATFNSIERTWIDACQQNCDFDIHKVLIGNKCDESSSVAKSEAIQLAEKHKMPFYETSVKKLDGKSYDFEEILHKIASKLKEIAIEKTTWENIPGERKVQLIKYETNNDNSTYYSSCSC